MLLPIIMAGGSGTRLWPLSRTLYPKQFLSLSNELTMLQDTLQRLSLIEHENPLLICNEEHRFIVAEQLRKAKLEHSAIVLEPVGRNTAPAVALAALHSQKNNSDPLLLVLAADHVIKNTPEFINAIKRAIPYAEQGNLVTFGIVPNKAETGYGYIHKGDMVSQNAYNVSKFVEKPDADTAQLYLEDGNYLWNSGIFLFKASIYISELGIHRPDILAACEESLLNSTRDMDFIRPEKKSFFACPDDSIDYAVMEHTKSAMVIPLDAEWSDVGSWTALWEVSDKDPHGNAIRGDAFVEDTTGSYIYSQNRLVTAVGVEDLVIVETKDAILVSHKDKVQKVKDIVQILKDKGRSEYLQHREVFRPWGSHDAIADGPRYHVKHVIVKPGQKTAMQIHHHRTEHWIVVSGTARVYCSNKEFLLTENQSTYIPIGEPHAIENPGKIPLEVIEVRSGTYLDEDDVVRFSASDVGY